MATDPTLKAELLNMIAAIDEKQRAMEELKTALKEAVAKMDQLPSEISGLLFVRGHLATEQETTAAPPSPLGMRSKQFKKIVAFFVQERNCPATVRQIMDAVGIGRSALANILYRTQKEVFISQRVPGERRLRMWTLKQSIYVDSSARAMATDTSNTQSENA
jgi:hypothetical protein